jgi:hypothetical protein
MLNPESAIVAVDAGADSIDMVGVIGIGAVRAMDVGEATDVARMDDADNGGEADTIASACFAGCVAGSSIGRRHPIITM